MDDYVEYFMEHDEIRKRIIEICQLFHRYDPRLYNDVAMDDIYFFYDNDNNICVFNNGIIELDFYCIFNVSYLTMSNDFISNEITICKKGRDEYDKRCIDLIKNKKK